MVGVVQIRLKPAAPSKQDWKASVAPKKNANRKAPSPSASLKLCKRKFGYEQVKIFDLTKKIGQLTDWVYPSTDRYKDRLWRRGAGHLF